MERVKELDKNILGAIAGALVFVGIVFLMTSSSGQGPVDPMVGPTNWGSGVKRETALGEYRVWESSDFKGGDLSFAEVSSIDDCLFACDEHEGCTYVSMAGKMCYLKNEPTAFESFNHQPSVFAAKRIKNKPLSHKDWNGAQVTEMSKATYRVWTNWAFTGPNVKQVMSRDIEGCLRVCDEMPECYHVTFEGGSCSIKSDAKDLDRVEQSGVMAALKVRIKGAPDPIVKHHWTKGEKTSTHHAVYQTWNRCMFHGDVITTTTADSLTKCLELCDNELFCKHVTLIKKECVLQGWAPEYFDFVPDRTDMFAAKKIEVKSQEPEHLVSWTGVTPKEDEVGDLHLDYLVGEHYDEAETRATKFNRYRVWEGFDFNGGDMHKQNLVLKEYTLHTCLEACDRKPECSHVVAVLGSECWLKKEPYQLERRADHRTNMFAAMKLGQVGKPGLDRKTKHKTNSLSHVRHRHKMSFLKLGWHALQDVGGVLLLVALLGLAGLGGFVLYSKSRGIDYRSELE